MIKNKRSVPIRIYILSHSMKEQTPVNNSIWVINKKLCHLSEPRCIVFLKELGAVLLLGEISF